MATLKAYTYIEEDVTIGGGGTVTVTHNIYTSSGIGHAQQQITLTPLDANGVGARIGTVADNSFVITGTATGHVRVHVQAVHSIQQ